MNNKFFFTLTFLLFFTSLYSQDFDIHVFSYKGSGMLFEKKIEGKIILKENYIFMETAMGILEGTTFVNKNGLTCYQSENRLNTLNIIDESGVILKMKYDYKIIIYCIDDIGGSTTTIYCTKK